MSADETAAPTREVPERTRLRLTLRKLGRHVVSAFHREIIWSLFFFQGSNECCWPKLETIMDDTGISSEASLRRYMKELVNAKAVRVERRWDKHGNRTSNGYRLTWEQADWSILASVRRKGVPYEDQPKAGQGAKSKAKRTAKASKKGEDASTTHHQMVPYNPPSEGAHKAPLDGGRMDPWKAPEVASPANASSPDGQKSDPEPSRRDPASTPPASQDNPSEPDLARGSSASPTEGESSAREAGSFVTSGQSSGLGGSSESPSNEPADPSNQPSFWGDPEPTSTPCGQSSPSAVGQSSPVPASQPSARPIITDIAGWKRLVHAQGGRDPIIAFKSDQLRTLAYLDVQDEAYWIWRHKQPDWHMTYGTDATWETPEGHPYPPRFPVQAIHFEIAEQKGLSLLQQLEKLRILDPPCRKSWEIALAHHLLTEKTYREQSDADERDFMDSSAPPDVLKERSTVVAGYLEAKKHRRWPEYALQGRSKDDLWALRAKETASLTRAAQRVSNGQIDRVA